jgi:hypothetical protein
MKLRALLSGFRKPTPGPDTGPPSDLMLLWQERRDVEELCRALRPLYERTHADSPELAGEALYAQLVQSHLGITSAAAADLVAGAVESYAQWPTPRPVRLRDVVHYLAATQLAQEHGRVAGDVRPVIQKFLPSEW